MTHPTYGRTVDVHAHLTAPAAEAMVASRPEHAAELAQIMGMTPASGKDYARRAAASWAVALTDESERLSRMDAAGVDVQVLSLNPAQYYPWADQSLGADLADASNTRLADAVRARPERFVALGHVSLQFPELAAEQLEKLMTQDCFRGAQISVSAGGREFSDPAYEPLWSVAEATGAVLFVHPLGCWELADRLAPAYLGNIIGQPLATTIGLSHLMFGGVLDRHPGLRLVLAHGGGFLPFYIGRADHAWEHRPDSRSMARRPSDYLRMLWVDSVVFRQDALAHLVDVVGADRVLLGTDYPFDMGPEQPLALLAPTEGDSDLTLAVRAGIAGGNARQLFSLT